MNLLLSDYFIALYTIVIPSLQNNSVALVDFEESEGNIREAFWARNWEWSVADNYQNTKDLSVTIHRALNGANKHPPLEADPSPAELHLRP